jgi:hypothetical protein
VLATEIDQRLFGGMVRQCRVLEDDKGLDALDLRRIGHANHARLGDQRMPIKDCLHLRRVHVEA